MTAAGRPVGPGSSGATPHVVRASDGVSLYAEVDAVAAVGGAADAARSGASDAAEAEAAGTEADAARGAPLDTAATPAEADAVGRAAGARPTIVFSHGYGLDLRCWDDVRALLRGRVRMVSYDHRSHGRSGHSAPDRCTLVQLADDLAAVVAALAPAGDVVLAGHSMGGMAVLELARRYPDLLGARVTGLALLATTAYEPADAESFVPGGPDGRLGRWARAALDALDRHPRVTGIGRAAVSFVARPLIARLAFATPPPADRLRRITAAILATPLAAIADFAPAFAGFDVRAELRRLGHVPSLVVGARDDRVIPVAQERDIAELLPGAEYLEFAPCDHLVMVEMPHQLAGALLAFADRVAVARRPGGGRR